MTRIRSRVVALESISKPICTRRLRDPNDIWIRLAEHTVRPNHKPFENPWSHSPSFAGDVNQRTGSQVPRVSRRVLLFSELVNEISHFSDNSPRNCPKILLDTSPILRY